MARWLACTIAVLFGIVLLSARGSDSPAGRAVRPGIGWLLGVLRTARSLGRGETTCWSGQDHADAICGLGGNDRLVGHGGDDVLRGGGNDALLGGSGNDQLLEATAQTGCGAIVAATCWWEVSAVTDSTGGRGATT